MDDPNEGDVGGGELSKQLRRRQLTATKSRLGRFRATFALLRVIPHHVFTAWPIHSGDSESWTMATLSSDDRDR